MLDEYVSKLTPETIVQGPIFPEPVKIAMVTPAGNSIRLIGEGLQTGKFYKPSLSLDQVALLEIVTEASFDGDSQKFRLGIEALRLKLAYEYDPYFSLSIARIDPLPHQLEAVYDYFLKLPRIRFLLADDPGAGKTIMAGLLIKELKIRGLVERILIVSPANLTFQWQREMKDKFREDFEVIRGNVLRSVYGSNPWQEKRQAITSISWVSRVEDARESLLRSRWDLIIVDEAHKMSAYRHDRKTLAYQLGESLSEQTDHYLLMTATPHKGDPQNFALFLSLLDKDVYGDVKSLETAMKEQEAPFYLRRVKEALITFPDPQTSEVKALFTKRNVQTIDFHIDADEWEFYDHLTRYVEDQSIKAAADDSARGRAIGFTMAMLQRRFASSVYAVRRTLERMRKNREKILEDPEKYRYEQMLKKVPEDFDELTGEEQDRIIAELEEVVASIDPEDLKEEIMQLGRLVDEAKQLEQREIESKLTLLKSTLTQNGIFDDSTMKLLIFSEHKDTLDYLVGDGKQGRPYGKLREWGLSVTQIHGGMKIGDRDTPGTRIYAEREFKESCQVMVATEAAGEGINLQFCWFMINYDIPWNPVRLEQRMGRIHRYGQEKDCLIVNFVATNTREGRVLQKLFERIQNIERDLDPQRTGKVFNVLGDIFPSNQLERMIRDMYAHNLTDDAILDRIIKDVDIERFQRITNSTLEGLAKRELNLSVILGKTAEAREKRLVPEVIEDFFLQAAPLSGFHPKAQRKDAHIYRIGKIPRTLKPIGNRLEPQFGRLGTEYKTIVFDKAILQEEPTLEWVTPGHPLFEAVREYVTEQTQDDLRQGTIFYDVHTEKTYRLDVFIAKIEDGEGHVLHERLYVMKITTDGSITSHQPTIFLDLIPISEGVDLPETDPLPDRQQVENELIEGPLQTLLTEVTQNRKREIEKISRHVEISLKTIIDRVQVQFAGIMDKINAGSDEPGLEGRLQQFENRLDELNYRLESRRKELEQGLHCMISDVTLIGSAWVLPYPERSTPDIAKMVQSGEIERIAVDAVIAYENKRGFDVESVEAQNRGFDLISRKPHPEDPKTAAEVRFIEVKGRSHVGEVALTTNEYKTAERLGKDYWLYVVYNCASQPEVHVVQNPARLSWQPIVQIEHYKVGSTSILEAEKT